MISKMPCALVEYIARMHYTHISENGFGPVWLQHLTLPFYTALKRDNSFLRSTCVCAPGVTGVGASKKVMGWYFSCLSQDTLNAPVTDCSNCTQTSTEWSAAVEAME